MWCTIFEVLPFFGWGREYRVDAVSCTSPPEVLFRSSTACADLQVLPQAELGNVHARADLRGRGTGRPKDGERKGNAKNSDESKIRSALHAPSLLRATGGAQPRTPRATAWTFTAACSAACRSNGAASASAMPERAAREDPSATVTEGDFLVFD